MLYQEDSTWSTMMRSNAVRLTYAPLITIHFWKLLKEGPVTTEEVLKLFEAAKTIGFFYLNLQNLEGAHVDLSNGGQDLLLDSPNLFRIVEEFFNLPLDEKTEYNISRQAGYYGYVVMLAQDQNTDGHV